MTRCLQYLVRSYGFSSYARLMQSLKKQMIARPASAKLVEQAHNQSAQASHHTKLQLSGIESNIESFKLNGGKFIVQDSHHNDMSMMSDFSGQIRSVGLQSSFKVQLMSNAAENSAKEINQDLTRLRQCDKCRKQVPQMDYERHKETCQKLVVHTSQNAQAPKVIEFGTLDSQSASKSFKTSAGVQRKPRVTSAKPPLTVNKNGKQEQRPIKQNNIPKWKLESEQLRRSLGRSSADSRSQYNVTERGSSAISRGQVDDRKQCPHCKRMFSDEASQRHFPICERNSQSSRYMIVRDKKSESKENRSGSAAAP